MPVTIKTCDTKLAETIPHSPQSYISKRIRPVIRLNLLKHYNYNDIYDVRSCEEKLNVTVKEE